ncbi:MAG: chromosome segregation protein SMC [Anaerosomatales bacterium]|nr:chromosome segregation protein SMC [Anaerosomatales bacterium]
MYLKSLTLKGFKSFADRSRMTFEPGAAVIVGPNGSGKSNISDAVLWVLGEQSAKQLRGNAMEDVIFAGSSARQPVGVAEVDLVLDNSDGTLPLEFDEVTITRRMFRSGESEYLVNQTPVRLMDVQELLHDTGLGRDTHSIISQGRIDEILNSKPEDRRSLIEEAAGVLKHKKRKERAVRKLTSMDVHVDRIKDVLAEIDRQLRPLQRQATKAAEYRDLAAELKELEVALAVADLRALQEQWDAVCKREREQDAEIELARYRLAEKERELAKFLSLLEEKGLFVGDLSEQRRRLQSVLERLNSGLLLLEEKGKNLVERLSELRQKIHHSESRLAQRLSEVEQIAEERAVTEARLQALYTQLGEVRREAETAKKERLAAEEVLTEVTAEQRRTRKELDDARLELADVKQALSAFSLETELLVERAEAVKQQRSALFETLAARRARSDQTTAELDRARRELSLAESEVDKHVRLVESRRTELTRRRDELTDLRAEIRALEEVDRAFEAASPALAWLLSKEKDLPGVLGPLTEHISVSEEYERVLEAALGSDVFCVLVRDPASPAEVVATLEAHGSGDYAVMPVAARHGEAPAGPGVRLVDQISCHDDVRAALEALIGDIRVLDTLEDALRAAAAPDARARFATRSGHIVWPSGKVRVGPELEEDSGVLARKRRLGDLRDALAATEASLGEAEAALVNAEESLSAEQQQALELSQRVASLAGEDGSTREEIGRLEQSITDVDKEAAGIDLRRRQIEERTAKDRPQERELDERIERATARLQELEEESAQRREERDTRYREESEVATRLSTCQVEIAAVSEREVHLKRRMAAAAAERAELDDTVAASRDTEIALETLRERIQPLHDLYSVLLERAEHWAVRLRDRARFEQADSESLRQTIHEAQEGVRTAQSAVEEASAAMSHLQVEKGQLEIQVTTAVAKVVEELGVPLERALQAARIDDREATIERAHRLRKRIANLGPVNPVAVEEFDHLQDRRDRLQEQLDDLLASQKALQKIIRAIDRKIRDRFLETFELVDSHFQEVFGVLFPGGQASLSLTDPDDPETTGVEVVAQPRGKRLQKMSLLSGGEKSLTALALLFAVYRTRPCPFYILDEVEAALDDSNLRRFIAFVDSLRHHTQFVIVTHQRRTMEMADVLYGVSMQADGVSKVVSQRLDRTTGELEEVADGAPVV